jgi:cation transporter-like permease
MENLMKKLSEVMAMAFPFLIGMQAGLGTIANSIEHPKARIVLIAIITVLMLVIWISTKLTLNEYINKERKNHDGR